MPAGMHAHSVDTTAESRHGVSGICYAFFRRYVAWSDDDKICIAVYRDRLRVSLELRLAVDL
jgi:hypothetical protein